MTWDTTHTLNTGNGLALLCAGGSQEERNTENKQFQKRIYTQTIFIFKTIQFTKAGLPTWHRETEIKASAKNFPCQRSPACIYHHPKELQWRL